MLADLLANYREIDTDLTSTLVSSLVDLILMKLLRIKQIEDNQGATLVSEGVDANFLDIVNYAVFAMIQLEAEAA